MLVALGLPVRPRETGCTAVSGSARFKEEIWVTALLPPYMLLSTFTLFKWLCLACHSLPLPSHAPGLRAGLHVRRPAVPIPGRTDNMVFVRLGDQTFDAYVQL